MNKRNLFDKVASFMFHDKLYMVLGMALIFTGLFISGRLLVADYAMSRGGYEMFPSHKAPGTVGAVALMPQFFQWLTLFIAISLQTDSDPDNDKYIAWVGVIGFTSMLFDIGTDLYFQTAGFQMTIEDIFVTIVESVVIFTMASDFLFAFCLSVLLAVVLRLFGRSVERPSAGRQSDKQRNKSQQQPARPRQNQTQQQQQARPRNSGPVIRNQSPDPRIQQIPDIEEILREARGRDE